ncbi:MAG: SUMF1/EgtB/PvdO family nonheme iron enzyme [Planctomycetaceae bacterium]|jgi:serine/threonine protein kinase|nr:SUMF1/EgtB/PvdO family nonheme iron enzyme [Planctomycetaceae bacterium]MBT6153433.1 SUMF1/EgtB/PvdO family nonheme iron enzyme [Planctomycetaceae bacterium]MBT6487298.1 SUMF1/EgtB/PvdO family nonheme iron enzyme [Planctomycetaceae bacterium]MBT6493695.1 SUMF1/EgtB/PvdO family nonheme iron enzyme [Planctomycetaceae bacterium]
MDSNKSVGSLPKTFGRYHIEKVLGEGAMGVVYLARDSKLDRQVALKVPKFDENPETMERFLREARAAATLDHRNICSVYDIGDLDGVHYISMAYIPGRPLSAFVDRKRQQPERIVASIVRKLALALDTAHQAGIIHRDLKPANVMLDQQNEPVIMDFGLARQLNENKNSRLTQSGSLMGSPAYMSPEQVNGEIDRIGPSSDIYSLGVCLYEFLTGEVPFDGPPAAVFGQILTQEPPKPSTFRPDLDPRLEAICQKMMAKQIDERYGTMREIAKALANFLKNDNPKEQQPDSAFEALFQAVALDNSPKRATVGGNAQRHTMAGHLQTQAAKQQTVSASSGTIQSTSEKLRQSLGKLPGWAKGTIGSVVAILLVYCITLPFRADAPPTADSQTPDSSEPAITESSSTSSPTTTVATPSPAKAPFSSTRAKEYQRAWAKHLGVEVEITNNIGMKMLLIPPGEFTMGSSQAEIEKWVKATNYAPNLESFRSEGPQHQVTLTKSFYLGAYEVTQTQYQLVMGANPSRFSTNGPQRGKVAGLETGQFPVETVSWLDGVDFCIKLSEREGLRPCYSRDDDRVTIVQGNGYRLPTEAEWEFACRAGTKAWWSFGNDEQELSRYGWNGSNSDDRTHAVGKLRSNPFGLYDMHGNVWEWCQDWHGAYRSKNSAVTDPLGPAQGTGRVLRGGTFNVTDLSSTLARSAFRNFNQPGVRHNSSSNSAYGFRVARTFAKKDYALQFDGKSGYVKIPSLFFDGNYPITIEAVVTPSKRRGHAVVVSDSFGTTGMTLRVRDQDAWNATGGFSGDWLDATAKKTIEVGKRVHVAAVWDHKVLSVHVEGKIAASSPAGRTDFRPSRQPFIIANYPGSATSSARRRLFAFNGRIEEIRVSSIARQIGSEIDPKQPLEADENTIALYHFDEGTGGVLRDSSGNEHHGQIVGAKWMNADGTPIGSK